MQAGGRQPRPRAKPRVAGVSCGLGWQRPQTGSPAILGTPPGVHSRGTSCGGESEQGGTSVQPAPLWSSTKHSSRTLQWPHQRPLGTPPSTSIAAQPMDGGRPKGRGHWARRWKATLWHPQAVARAPGTPAGLAHRLQGQKAVAQWSPDPHAGSRPVLRLLHMALLQSPSGARLGSSPTPLTPKVQCQPGLEKGLRGQTWVWVYGHCELGMDAYAQLLLVAERLGAGDTQNQ